jgi:hypothetical protein
VLPEKDKSVDRKEMRFGHEIHKVDQRKQKRLLQHSHQGRNDTLGGVDLESIDTDEVR